MSVTTFQEKLAASGRASGHAIAGRKLRRISAIPPAEFRALLQGCAVLDMSWQAKLVLAGEDRVRWLNGMVTNNVRDLAPGHGVYSFILSAQGRIQGDLVAYNRGDYLLVTTDREQAPAIAEIFRPLHHHGRRRGRRHQRQAGRHWRCGPESARDFGCGWS